ncbi:MULTISPECIES: ChaN family lipoprotein [Trichocoleus]|uniref:ChaN family lipoprotein n=1 Tax=Trichocoleus desertorum GB2-A4 TaxID=2933944 RepID=A0ABV0J4M5_9CYAN|nr:ChaN family lipoprotein [Trichocoleus sp. FACHB-46]MBD1862074.1 ChaN family lipoprotein [Trichocoleus sp. FACHB-46]
MSKGQLIKLWAWSLGLFLCFTSPAPAQTIFSPMQQRLSPQTVLRQLAAADVVYLGETHDSPADHRAQLKIIQALHQKQPRLAIALEMFQRPYQPALDRYLAGQITEAELRQQSQFDQRWGYDWEYYAPILRFAKAKRLPLIALNTPTEITRKVARQGLDSLTASDRQFIPPAAEIRTDNVAYRQRIQKIYEEMHQGHSSSKNFEQFFEAQVLWDETMAERIAQFATTHPNSQIVVLAGQGHIIYGDGIPSRVTRRLKNTPNFVQRLVLLNPENIENGGRAIADYLWKEEE